MEQEKPIQSAQTLVKALSEKKDTVVDGLVNITKGLFNRFKKLINYDYEDQPNPKEQKWFKTPIDLIRDASNATILNIFRRGATLLENSSETLNAAYRGFSRPFLHPIDTFQNFGKYFANYPRIITAGTKTLVNAVLAPTKVIYEGIDSGIRKPLNRLESNIGWIPAIGTPTFMMINKTGEGLTTLSKAPKDIGALISQTAENIDATISRKQFN